MLCMNFRVAIDCTTNPGVLPRLKSCRVKVLSGLYSPDWLLVVGTCLISARRPKPSVNALVCLSTLALGYCRARMGLLVKYWWTYVHKTLNFLVPCSFCELLSLVRWLRETVQSFCGANFLRYLLRYWKRFNVAHLYTLNFNQLASVNCSSTFLIYVLNLSYWSAVSRLMLAAMDSYALLSSAHIILLPSFTTI